MVMWEKHGVCAVGPDVMEAFDQIDVLSRNRPKSTSRPSPWDSNPRNDSRADGRASNAPSTSRRPGPERQEEGLPKRLSVPNPAKTARSHEAARSHEKPGLHKEYPRRPWSCGDVRQGRGVRAGLSSLWNYSRQRSSRQK